MFDPIQDDTFGLLEWDADLECWLGGIDWLGGGQLGISIWLPDGDVDLGLRQAKNSLIWLRENEQLALQCVVRQMLEIYNDFWRGSTDPIGADDFVRTTELVYIEFVDDGSLQLAYDGRELFGGHTIKATFRADRSYRGASLIG